MELLPTCRCSKITTPADAAGPYRKPPSIKITEQQLPVRQLLSCSFSEMQALTNKFAVRMIIDPPLVMQKNRKPYSLLLTSSQQKRGPGPSSACKYTSRKHSAIHYSRNLSLKPDQDKDWDCQLVYLSDLVLQYTHSRKKPVRLAYDHRLHAHNDPMIVPTMVHR